MSANLARELTKGELGSGAAWKGEELIHNRITWHLRSTAVGVEGWPVEDQGAGNMGLSKLFIWA